MKSHLFVHTFFALIAATISAGQTTVVGDWLLRHPQPYYDGFFNAAYGNGVYVIVGAGGMIATSSDLEHWHAEHHPELLENVVFGNGRFVASGYNGDMLTSTDGTNWTAYATGTSFSFSGICYENGLYVAAGEAGASAVSSNGMDWTVGSTGEPDYWFWGTSYGQGRFVAAATHYDYDGTIRIVTSTNGTDWSTAELPAGLPEYTELWDIGYADGRFTAVGYWETLVDPDNSEYIWGPLILTSTDGLSWTRVIDPDIPDTDNQWVLWAIDHDGSQWVGVGQNGLIMTSSDGLDWMTRPSPLGTTDEFYGLAIGSGGRVVPVGYRAVYSTTDLVTWTDHTTGSYPDLRKIAYNGTQYVAGRNAGRVLTSEDDGATWTDRTSGVSGRITGIAYGMNRWVISSDSISAFTHFPLGTSTNGIDWVRPDTSEDFTDCRGVAYGNGVFVAIPKTGTSTLAYSTDGLNWTETTHPWFTALQDRNFIAFGGDHFVAWGDSNSTVSVAISSNGTDWQTYSTGLATPVPEAGAYGNGRWVLVGDDGRVLTSTDLVNWSAQTILFEGDLVDLNDVAYGNGHWVIVGNDQTVWSSADGVNWDAAFRTQLGWNFYGVTFDGDSFWCVGERGAIYESQLISSQLLPPVLRIQSSSIPSAVELHIEGVSGEMWNVDYKPVLTNASWIYETTVTLTNDSHVHVQSLPESGQGFFRLSQP